MIGPGIEGASFNAYAYSFGSGLEGTITVTIETSDGDLVLAPTTGGIIEIDAGGETSVYRYVGSYPPVGEYVIIWEDPDGVQAAEALVTGTTIDDIADPLPSGPTLGPCQDWVTAEDVLACCNIDVGSDDTLLQSAASMASELLYRLSAKKFSGLCVKTIRPCRSGCGCDHSGYDDWYWRGTDWVRSSDFFACGCGCVSQITLSGTARAIVEVKIGGEVIAPDEYRLDEFKYLVRMADADGKRQAWPRCQRLDLPGTEAGTFEITYIAGIEPPALAVSAAAALACELYRACPGVSAGVCALPSGVTRIVRQGLTIERVDSVASMLRRGASGIPYVDAFIAAYNPTGAIVGPMVWSPDLPAHRRVSG